MRDTPIVDQRQTDLWLWRHGQGERGDRAPLVREICRVALGRDIPDEEVDLLLDLASDGPDWLAIRTLPDGRFAAVGCLIFAMGVRKLPQDGAHRILIAVERELTIVPEN